MTAVVLDARDPHALATFYSALLGWPIGNDEPDWVTVRPPDGSMGISVQLEPDHVPPVWPATSGGQQRMQAHLDIEVDDLDAASARARELGATLADHQPQDDVRVHLDPAGHPFCLWIRTG
jgi:predicted enzyme related to lactoylglutathione lyase